MRSSELHAGITSAISHVEVSFAYFGLCSCDGRSLHSIHSAKSSSTFAVTNHPILPRHIHTVREQGTARRKSVRNRCSRARIKTRIEPWQSNNNARFGAAFHLLCFASLRIFSCRTRTDTRCVRRQSLETAVSQETIVSSRPYLVQQPWRCQCLLSQRHPLRQRSGWANRLLPHWLCLRWLPGR